MGSQPSMDGGGYAEPSEDQKLKDARKYLDIDQQIAQSKAQGQYYDLQRQAIPVQSELTNAQILLQQAQEQAAQNRAMGRGNYDVSPQQQSIADIQNRLSGMTYTPAFTPITTGRNVNTSQYYFDQQEKAKQQAADLQKAMDEETAQRNAYLDPNNVNKINKGGPVYKPSDNVRYFDKTNTYVDSRADLIKKQNELNQQFGGWGSAQKEFEASQAAKAADFNKSMQAQAEADNLAQTNSAQTSVEAQRQSDLQNQYLTSETGLLAQSKTAQEKKLEAAKKAGAQIPTGMLYSQPSQAQQGYSYPNLNLPVLAGSSSANSNRM